MPRPKNSQQVRIEAAAAAAIRDIPDRAVVSVGKLDDLAVRYPAPECVGDLRHVPLGKQLAQTLLDGRRSPKLAQPSDDLWRLWARSTPATHGSPDQVAEVDISDRRAFRHCAMRLLHLLRRCQIHPLAAPAEGPGCSTYFGRDEIEYR